MVTNVSKVSAEKPLEGALLCCTSIPPEDRALLAEYAEEMGAKHTLDLTSDVTHLLVGHTDSKKYQYVAKEREDVKVLLPDWVEAVRQKWMADEYVDFNALDAQYRCPTLYGLKICITGFEDLDFRTELAKNIAKNGGQYTGDLTKDVTHLIAFVPQGKKYEYAGAWGIKVVSIKWYKDTLDRGMQLDESLYHPTMAPETQGRGAWNRRSPDSSKLGKRQRDDPPAQEPSRKFRRAASARFSSQQNDMWSDIVGRPPSADLNTDATKLRPIKSMSNVEQMPESASSRQGPQRSEYQDRMASPFLNGFLTGNHFAQKGFDEARKSRLFDVLRGNGASVYQTVSELLDRVESSNVHCFLVVPHEIDYRQLTMVRKNLRNAVIVTELWLEYCMTVKAFVPPESYPLGTPVCPIDIPDISKITINASGFHQVQTMHIAKIVKKLGAVYRENFTQETSVLVTNSSNPNQQKIQHAMSWKVPVVTEKWLWNLITTNKIPSFDRFSVEALNRIAKANAETAGQSHARGQRPSLHDPSRGNAAGSDNEDSFVEAAKAIEAREKQPVFDEKRHSLNSNQTRQSPYAPSLEERTERQKPTEKHLPLQEISANIVPQSVAVGKKKLFQQFDGSNNSLEERSNCLPVNDGAVGVVAYANKSGAYEQPYAPPVVDSYEHSTAEGLRPISVHAAREPNTDSNLVREFFEAKAAAEARKSQTSLDESKPKKNKLIGRALSNLSNSSRRSNEDPISNNENTKTKGSLSRASSINSVNTDGLGVPLSNLSHIPSDLVTSNTANARRQLPPSLNGNSKIQPANTSMNSAVDKSNEFASARNDDTSFHAALATLSTSQLPQPPSPTQQDQLTYADSDEAAKLRARLAEKRRNRARLGQQETDPGPKMSREENERRKANLAREESEEKRQARWRAERDRGVLIKDDEKVVGAGRRTRGREKQLSALGGGVDFQDEARDGLFGGL